LCAFYAKYPLIIACSKYFQVF